MRPPAASFRFSTDDVPRGERVRAVRELHDRGVLPLAPLEDRQVHVDIAVWFLPQLAIMSGTLRGLRQEGARRASHDELFFGINLAGRPRAVQRGHEIVPDHGDAVLFNVAAGPFSVIRPGRTQFVGLRVPTEVIAPLVHDLDVDVPRLIPGAADSVALLTGYTRAVLGGRLLEVPETSRLVVSHVHDLIALSLGATQDATALAEARSVPAARLRTIKSDIVANLEDEGLTVGAIAARHGVTPRYVHRLFEREGVTYTQFVLRQRLERAWRMLQKPGCATRSISAIAYDVGFGDLSYFNRAFRRYYHRTPSDVRNRTRDG